MAFTAMMAVVVLATTTAAAKPNIFMVIVDDFGWADSGWATTMHPSFPFSLSHLLVFFTPDLAGLAGGIGPCQPRR